ncbi:MAG: hypothetical protein CMJ94_12610 [Planctomycetes bacterium]|nr:hypothetical protein [Planctomycetota bacterium]
MKIPQLLALALLAGAAQPAVAQQAEVPATAPEVDSLKISGTFRLRGEGRSPDMSASQRDYLARVRLNFDIQVDDFIGAFIEFQNATTAGAESDQDLHQAYATLSDLFNLVDMQVGRFEMKYGNQRMVSPLDWSNTGRAWDGARFQHNSTDYTFDFFLTKPVEGQGGSANGNRNFTGLYYERKLGEIDTDWYLFSRQDGGRDDYTLGFLLEGEVEGYSWDAELAAQFGDADVGVDAGGLALALRADTKVAGDWKIGVGYEYASGDTNTADGSDDGFAPLFDFGHAYHGNQDLLIWNNLSDFVIRTAAPIDDNWNWYGDLHIFYQAEEEVSSGEDYLGLELDLGLKGYVGQNVLFWGGLSQFIAGDTDQRNGALNEDETWIFAQVGLRF